jgi:hypothetical protein
LSVVLFFPQLRNFAQSGHTAPIWTSFVFSYPKSFHCQIL